MQSIDISRLLLVGSNQSLEIRASLSLHVLANKDCTGLASSTLDFEGRANDREADLGLVDVCDCVSVRLLELADELLWVTGRCARIALAIEVEPLLEDT